LHFSIDAFEVTNRLGSHTSVHKLEALHMIIQNFPSEAQSKLSQVFLVAIWHAQDVKTHGGYDKILSPVVQDLKKLESDEGMSMIVRDAPVIVRAAVVLISADNLGFNSLLGFSEGFSAKKFCRFCDCIRDETDTHYVEADCSIRTVGSYNASVACIHDQSYDPRARGIQRGCILNQLQYFHPMQNYLIHVMHDFLEGVVPFELGLILTELNMNEFITLDSSNLAISFFNYSLADRNSRPPSLSSVHSLKMSASDMWCFVRNLPLMIGHKIPRDNAYWKLLLMLLDIADIVFAPAITKKLSYFLAHLIDDHHAYFKELFPDERLLPKHHFSVHYPTCLVKSGPPVRYWCVRFEARHSFLKELAKLSHDYRNICQTLAVRFQLSLANMLMDPAGHLSHEQVGPCDGIMVGSLNDNFADIVCNEMGLCRHDYIFVAQWINIGYNAFQRHEIVVHDIEQGIPQF
jgi:hypothetical protein